MYQKHLLHCGIIHSHLYLFSSLSSSQNLMSKLSTTSTKKNELNKNNRCHCPCITPRYIRESLGGSGWIKKVESERSDTYLTSVKASSSSDALSAGESVWGSVCNTWMRASQPPSSQVTRQKPRCPTLNFIHLTSLPTSNSTAQMKRVGVDEYLNYYFYLKKIHNLDYTRKKNN